MKQLNLMSPEAEELLREIASESKSSLLRVPRRRSERSLVSLSGERFDREPGRSRSRAERQLAEVTRSEVARVLRDVCSSRLVNDSATKRTTNPHTRDGAVEYPTIEPPCAGPVAFYDEDVEEALVLLGRNAEAETPRSRPSIGQLATLANKLSPHPRSQLQIGFDLMYKGQTQTARRLLNRVGLNASTSVRASALEASAFCWALDGNPGQAFHEFLAAYKLGSPRPSSLMSAFVNAVDWGDANLVQYTGRLVNDAFSSNEPGVRHFIRSHTVRKRSGDWKTTDPGRRVAQSNPFATRTIAGEFLHVYAS